MYQDSGLSTLCTTMEVYFQKKISLLLLLKVETDMKMGGSPRDVDANFDGQTTA